MAEDKGNSGKDKAMVPGRQTGRRKRGAEAEVEEKSAEDIKSPGKDRSATILSKADQKEYEVQVTLWEVQFREGGFAKCSLCYCRRRYMESMLAHFKTCSAKKPASYSCRHCQKVLQSSAGLKYHLMTSHHDVSMSHLSSDNSATDSTELNTGELKMILKIMGKLVCRNKDCSKTFSTYQGYSYHQRSCGKEAEEFICEICAKVYISKPGLVYHMKAIHRPPPEEVAPSEKPEETEQGSDRVKRKAAQRAINNLQNMTKELKENEGSTQSDRTLADKVKTLYRTPSVMPTSLMGEKCRLAIENGEEVKCSWEGCNQMFRSWSLFRSHYTMCYKNPDADDGQFLCLVCGKGMTVEKSIRAHIRKLHKQKLREVLSDDDSYDDEDDTDYEDDSEDYEGDKRFGAPRANTDRASTRVERCQREIKRTSTSNISHFMKLAYNERRRRFGLSDGRTHLRQEIAVDWSSWNNLSPSESKQYLPEAGRSIRFTIGPGRTDQEPSSLALFEVLPSQPECKPSLNFFVGGPVWSLAWCPRPPSQDVVTEYAAIGCHRSFDECHYVSRIYTDRGAVQLWAFEHLQQLSKQEPSCRLVCCLAHEYGCIWDMKWCPSGCWQNETPTTYKSYGFDEDLLDTTKPSDGQHTTLDNGKQERTSADANRIGVLALACADGTVRFLNIPSSDYIQQLRNGPEGESPSVFSLQPSLTLWPGLDPSGKVSASFGQCWCVEWVPDNGHTKVAAGFSNGSVAIWDVICRSALLRIQPADLLPFLVFEGHDARVLKLSWCPFDSNYLVSVSKDRQVKFWDLRAPSEPVVSYSHSLCTDCSWLDYSCGIAVTSDVMSRALNRGTCLCTGSAADCNRIVFSNSTCTDWCVHSSDWLHSLLIGNDNGNVSLCLLPQLTNFDAMKRNEYMGRKWHVYSSNLHELKASDKKVSKEPNPIAAETSCDSSTPLAPSQGATHVDRDSLTGIQHDIQTIDENFTGVSKNTSINGNCLTGVNHTTSVNTQTNGGNVTGVHHKSHMNVNNLTGASHNMQNEGNNLTGTNHHTQSEGGDFTGIHHDTHEGVGECTEDLQLQEPCCQVGGQNLPSNEAKIDDNAAPGQEAEIPEFQNFDLELSDLLKTCNDLENMTQESVLQEENLQSVSDQEARDNESNAASSVSHEGGGPQRRLDEGKVRSATSGEAGGSDTPQEANVTKSSESLGVASQSTRSDMHDSLRTTTDNKECMKPEGEDDGSSEQRVEVTWGTSKTFQDYKKKVYISFCDSKMDDFGNSEWKAESLTSQPSATSSCQSLRQRSAIAIHKACHNPNLGTHTWLLSGGQTGIMRLHCIDALQRTKITNALASHASQE